jgi:hypothetical protein
MSSDSKVAAIIVAAGVKSSLIPLYERGTNALVANDDFKEKCHRLPLLKGE